jgi:hypothetical protein
MDKQQRQPEQVEIALAISDVTGAKSSDVLSMLRRFAILQWSDVRLDAAIHLLEISEEYKKRFPDRVGVPASEHSVEVANDRAK